MPQHVHKAPRDPVRGGIHKLPGRSARKYELQEGLREFEMLVKECLFKIW